MARARLVLLHRSIPDRSRRGSGLCQCESHCGELDGAARRGVCSSLFIAGVGVAGTLTPILMGWCLYATNRPEEHPRANTLELKYNHSAQGAGGARMEIANLARPGTLWRKRLSKASVWALMLSYLRVGCLAYIYYT